ncbi:hypothetical protein HU675_0010735 [Bradyrhizobium septentrionale]|uniref:hypothetical protein n=1 Tax=Bradyrhizobium septentrionale TaxID=1404411 RepID=UPI00159689A1|nr:hypothetical protein [Bradyrhizobium septentrionale]UGY27185.1 hypothetical protein HU675_0010735 [Bradyrhizobium septentrionale]
MSQQRRPDFSGVDALFGEHDMAVFASMAKAGRRSFKVESLVSLIAEYKFIRPRSLRQLARAAPRSGASPFAVAPETVPDRYRF